jgi:hypothetical protein
VRPRRPEPRTIATAATSVQCTLAEPVSTDSFVPRAIGRISDV